MKPPVVVVDTNVVIAGLISNEADSPVCRILDGMLAGRFTYVLSDALLDEYRRVLLRDTIRKLHGLSMSQVDVILTAIVTNAVVREPKDLSHSAPDPGDDHLWHLLGETDGSILVTGDQKLIDNPPAFAAIVSPRSFVEALDATSASK